MESKTIIFIGPQGSGKGTQIDSLIQKLKEVDSERLITHIQTGKPFRELAAKGGFAADVVKKLITTGALVPNVLTNALVVQDFVTQHVEDAHVIFDGFPRDIEQTKVCDDLFKLFLRDSLDIVYLDAAEDVVMERMLKRGRDDDTEEVIANRLQQYHKSTEPLLDYYRSRPNTTVHTVNGAGTEQEVRDEIFASLNIS